MISDLRNLNQEKISESADALDHPLTCGITGSNVRNRRPGKAIGTSRCQLGDRPVTAAQTVQS